jgi:hypothetical protein
LLKGILKENIIYCPKCGHCNYNLTNDYKLVDIGGNKYVEFVARCLKDKCGEKFYYQSKISMQDTKRFCYDRKDEKEIKEEI